MPAPDGVWPSSWPGCMTAGPWQGALYERLSDPWKGVSQDVNSKGTRYMSELAVELHLQLIELGLARLATAAGD